MIGVAMALAVATGGACQPSTLAATQVADRWAGVFRSKRWLDLTALVAQDGVLTFDGEEISPSDLVERLSAGELAIPPLERVDRSEDTGRVVDIYFADTGCMPMPRLANPDGSLGPSRTICARRDKPNARIEYTVREGCIVRLSMTTI